MTGPQKSALKWLRNRGGDGVFDKTKVLIARGERAGVMRQTWNIIRDLGAVEIYANNKRVKVTEYGDSIDLSQVYESECREIGD